MTRTTWRILTWNLRGSAGPDLRAVADAIRSFEPDVVALQEIQPGQARRLASALGWSHRWTRKHYPFTPLLWWRAEGLAVMTPHALGDVHRQTISPGVSTWTYRHRVLLAATVSRDGHRLRVYDTHLAAHHRPDERIAQAARVAARVLADAHPLAVVAGDLNADGEVEVLREFAAVDVRDPGGPPSHPSIAPTRRLDYVLVPAHTHATEIAGPDGGETWWAISDHLPVGVEVTIEL